ncbi:MIZ zinc finger family protein [Tritrichomonas foetus]|uniref:MIZ zinc finger family protein n=1 Tax=Tritrichomonas foetus TaxID=1144522 RepID=A0A1J4K063_9EUKA|nr:MIZ zinc finger family protein [Tritrichomonas foetus]|eukprot:OHT04619.1 MIZ zinc finger family protein [Tritrichomonas foetus]
MFFGYGDSTGSFKRKKGTRVARLLQNPSQNQTQSFIPQIDNQSLSSFPNFTQQYRFSQPMVHNTSSEYTHFHVPVIGQVFNNQICFRLSTRLPTLYCPFSFTPSSGHRAVLSCVPHDIILPFVLNDIPFSYNGCDIDLTDHLREGENHFAFNTMAIQCEVMASVQWRFPENLDGFVQKIINEFPSMEMQPTSQFLSEIDPILKNRMQYPGRGMNCSHCQCFDLKNFLEYSRNTGNWNCPICGKVLDFNELRYDPSFIKKCDAVFAYDDFIDNDCMNGMFL